MRKIAFINQKGGVGKTTTTINAGAGLAQMKKRVLLIDLDPQGNLSSSLGINTEESEVTTLHLLTQQTISSEDMVHKNNFYVIPATIALASLEQQYSTHPEREFLLKNALTYLANQFDFILFDCPPSLGLLTLNALAAANEVYIPMQTEYLALQGLSQLLDTCRVVSQRINPTLRLGGIIGIRYNRRRLNKEIVQHLKESFAAKMCETTIRENIALAEAPSHGKDIYEYKPDSIGAQDYKRLCKEIISRSTNI